MILNHQYMVGMHSLIFVEFSLLNGLPSIYIKIELYSLTILTESILNKVEFELNKKKCEKI